jgi:hypothetical protein
MAKTRNKKKDTWYVGTTTFGRLIVLPQAVLREMEAIYERYEMADEDEKEELAYMDGLPVPGPENMMTRVDFPDCIDDLINGQSNMTGFRWMEVDSKLQAEIVEQLREAGFDVVEDYRFPEPDDVDW